jgi:ring-1,2-phenylacetyl-CoA epoxidase subunit PaaE
MVMSRGSRKATVIDAIARVVSRAAPRAMTPAIDRARRDLHAVIDGARGARSSLVSDPVPPPLEEVRAARVLLPRTLAARVETVERDAAMLRRALRGEKAPFLVARKPRAEVVRLRPKAGLAYRTLRVVRIERETEEASTIQFEDASGAPIDFDAGQFLTIELDVDGEPLRRAYSFSSSPDDGAVTITVKRIAGGRVSSFLNERLRVGDTLRARGPSGSFVAGAANGPRELVLFAGGSGITPLFSIAKTVLAREPATKVTLVYGNQCKSAVIFSRALRELQLAHDGRFSVDHVLEDASDDARATTGRLDRDLVLARLDALRLADHAGVAYLVCGPDGMRRAVADALAARGVDPLRVREEIFLRPELRRDGAKLPSSPVLARIRVGATERALLVAPGKTLLEAGLDAELPMPFSCTMGGCAACKVKLVSGEVQMEEPNCLSDRERDEGYVLACVSRPIGPIEVEVEP